MPVSRPGPEIAFTLRSLRSLTKAGYQVRCALEGPVLRCSKSRQGQREATFNFQLANFVRPNLRPLAVDDFSFSMVSCNTSRLWVVAFFVCPAVSLNIHRSDILARQIIVSMRPFEFLRYA
jgi:hypothetical protein